MSRLSIIIPIYNEENFIDKTLTAIAKSNSLKLKKEIILINDGSTDSTTLVLKKKLKQIKKSYPNIVLKSLGYKHNLGKGAAVKLGISNSTGDIVLIQDADLEYSPEDYPDLLSPFIKFGADVVYGSRFVSNKPHRVLYFWHYVINSFLTLLSNMLTNLNLTDMETGLKAFRGTLIRDVSKELVSKGFGFEPEITARLSKNPEIKFFEVGVSYSGRTYKEGKKIVWLDGLKAIFQIIKFNLID